MTPVPAAPVKCYGVRRLNPFYGVVQVVDTPAGRALSTDGLGWQLQVLAERPEPTWGSLNRGRARQQFFRFGRWHPDEGMTRVPVNPVLDVGAMLAAAQALIDTLQQVRSALPFALTDRYEHWLLDQALQPLALLASTVAERLMIEVETSDWQATLPAGEPFLAPSLQARGVPLQDPGSRRRHAEQLEAQVRGAAGQGARRHWIRRTDDGGGASVDTGAGELTWPAAAFPVTGLRNDWPEPAEAALVADYLDWLAPRLLTLPGLPDALRLRLEHAAASHALLVEAQYRLYPKILAPQVIDAARVEARLRQAAAGA